MSLEYPHSENPEIEKWKRELLEAEKKKREERAAEEAARYRELQKVQQELARHESPEIPSRESERPSLRNNEDNPEPPQESKTLDTSETIALMKNTIADLERAVGELGQQVKEGLNAERPKELSEQALEQLLGISKETIQASEQALEQLISISNEAIQASKQLTSRLVEDAREGMERLRQLSEEAAMGAKKIRQSSEEQSKQIAEERGKEVQRS